MEAEPPVVLFVRGFTPPAVLRHEDAGRFRADRSWPPEEVRDVEAVPSADGRLLLDPPPGESAASGLQTLDYRPDAGMAAGRYAIGQMLPGWGMADDQRLDEPVSLVYSTDPLVAPLELIGTPAARLEVSRTARVSALSVKLCDVAPDGTSALVTKGFLNLGIRDPRPEQPPAEPRRVDVPLQAAAYRFAAGHRVRLMISAADFQNSWPTPEPHTLTIHLGRGCSAVVLPCLPPDGPPAPEPVFLPSEFPAGRPEEMNTPEYRIERDLVRRQVRVTISTLSGIALNDSRTVINLERPAEATVESGYEYPLDRPGLSVRVRSRCLTRSDAAAFHHLVRVEARVNGEPFWSREWSRSAPRQGF